ncbi:B3 domain-containing protein At3g19184-like [Chenopodium quinoa]|uniref:B3 domain-containing protein At3g19184-like n=1 Tax=Chenopodium quinoa TaxID=63459 RepID=UPI000B77BDEB|nr:B3 domain-containing protein At3g19184-like [Chenopodium quinoa]XP_021738465.1 B3 domain-containing protein At3g19184-like [Chenopodium quinoa]
MVTTTASYEDKRKQRLEENKKRMEQLNLHKLAQALKPSPRKTHHSSPAKKVKARSTDFGVSSVRRSSRTADKPPPNYKEYAMEPMSEGRRIYKYKRRDILNRVYASDKDRVYAIERAEELEQQLGSAFPAFIKPMLQSHVTGGFWLSFPIPFCKVHLPDEDEMVTLVDEDGDEWKAKYLARKNGLSGGWRGFSIDHELVDGDALVFQLIEPTTFKVYIIRVNSTEEEDEE